MKKARPRTREGRRAYLELGLDAVRHPDARPAVRSKVDAGQPLSAGVTRGKSKDGVFPRAEGAGLDGDVLE